MIIKLENLLHYIVSCATTGALKSIKCYVKNREADEPDGTVWIYDSACETTSVLKHLSFAVTRAWRVEVEMEGAMTEETMTQVLVAHNPPSPHLHGMNS